MTSNTNDPNENRISSKQLARYFQSDWKRSSWQLINSLVPYFSLLIIMYLSLDYAYWITLLLALPAAGFLVRIFIIFHDCGHGSFFKSNRLNTIIGFFSGLLVFTPYHEWRFNHARHHATCSDLDRRGTGDVWTLTVNEYLALSKKKKLAYRLYRHPLVMFGLGPLFMFLISHRLTTKDAKKREKRSVYLTNVALLMIVIIALFTIGWQAYLLIQLPVIFLAGLAGIWLFYVQHQFENVYWEKHENWDFNLAALKGSSYYKLPRVLQWFSGNIGFHPIHHLSARIPNYNLPACQKQIAAFAEVRPITFWKSLKQARLRLWDENQLRMVGFGSLP